MTDLRNSESFPKLGPPPSVGPGPTEQEQTDFVRRVENAALRDAIGLRAAFAAGDRNAALGWTAGKPNMSQLGALRSVMADLSADDLERAAAFVRAIASTDRASRWGAGAVDLSHPLGILQNLFEHPETIWRKISMPEPEWRHLLISRAPADAQADSELQRFTIASFLFAAMRLHKRESESQTRNGGT
jgi:hypothetical protein